MDLEDIKNLVKDADLATSATREEASDMLVFGRITQWDEDYSSSSALKYQGQFDLIKPKRNKIISELMANPVSVSFKPQDGADIDSADVLNGAFRRSMQSGEGAYETAVMDQVDCGMGAFRVCTEYKSKRDSLDNTQIIEFKTISEANNRVYVDPNCKSKDKSDMRWCLVVSTFTKSGWENYCEENGINYDSNENPPTFKEPGSSNTYFWRGKQNEIKIGEFYSKEKKRERIFIYESPLGEVKSFLQKEIKDVQQELDESGFIKIGEKYQDKYQVFKYLVDGEKVIKTTRIAGEYIPIVLLYGDHSFVEGREIWRGIYHDPQDAQRLHNFLMSYTTDIVAQGPRQKPIFYPGQIKGFEFMYADNGADNNFPYLLQNEVSQTTGQTYNVGPVGYIEPPQIPQAQAALMQEVRQAVDDVTGSTLASDQMLNSQVTEGQIAAVQASANMETFLYQNNAALAMKQCGRIFASMFQEIMDVPQEVTLMDESGKESQVMIMESVIDYETGEEVVLNDVSQGSYEVYSSTGPNYTSHREQARVELKELFQATANLPQGQIFLLTYLTMQEGPGFESIRTWARNQLILQGIEEPETEEEEQMLMQAKEQQANKQDPNMVLAMAEQAKAQAMQMDSQVKVANAQVNEFKAETDRIKAVADIGKTQAEIQKMGSEIKGNELDNIQKLAQGLMPQRPRTVQ